MWDNKNNNEPDFSSKAYIQSTLVLGDTAETITVYHKNNGVISTYYLTSFNKSVYKKNTLNGVTSEEIKNLKMYKNISDTTGPFKYVSAKWTCNGK